MSESPLSPDRRPEDRTRVAWTGEDEIQARIVERVAEVAGVEPTDLEPLYQAVDPDALDRLVRGSAGFRAASFVYAGHHVRLFADGQLTVNPTG